MELPWFGRREADQLMERLMPDRKQREFSADLRKSQALAA